MEISGNVLRRSPAAVELAGIPRIYGRRVRFPSVRFADEGHIRYYGSPMRCEIKNKEDKNRVTLVKGLGDELSAIYSNQFNAAEELDEKMITEEAEALLAQLKQLRSKEKENKKRKKLERAKMKSCAGKMKKDSSSSSSESSDSECEVDNSVIDKSCNSTEPNLETKFPKMAVCVEEDSSCSSSESSDSECEHRNVLNKKCTRNSATAVDYIPEINLLQAASQRDSLSLSPSAPIEVEAKIVLDSSSKLVGCCNNVSKTTGSKIEVCMGGKCKKSGAAELMAEFERKIGIEGAVVGCKCMGKCRDGPNVRVRYESTETKNPLCIGVGLDDVGTIAAKFLVEKKDEDLVAA